MGKTILVPTDFSINSLHVVKCALERNPDVPMNLVMVTGVWLPGSIMDLLFFSKETVISNLSGNEFKEACQIVRNRYMGQIKSIRFEIFTGFTNGAFRMFLEGNKIDEIYIPKNTLQFTGQCFDPIPYMRKVGWPKQIVSWPQTHESVGSNHLSELFTSWT